MTSACPWGFPSHVIILRAFSTFIQRALSQNSPQGAAIHYLDDFLFIGPAKVHVCSEMLDCFFNICRSFGIPIAHEKTMGPVTVIKFLCITIDSVAMEFRLPMSKILKIRLLNSNFLTRRRVVFFRNVQSLLGLFAFVSRVIPVARVFSRRFAVATKGLTNPLSHVSITRPIKGDLRVWDQFR